MGFRNAGQMSLGLGGLWRVCGIVRRMGVVSRDNGCDTMTKLTGTSFCVINRSRTQCLPCFPSPLDPMQKKSRRNGTELRIEKVEVEVRELPLLGSSAEFSEG